MEIFEIGHSAVLLRVYFRTGPLKSTILKASIIDHTMLSSLYWWSKWESFVSEDTFLAFSQYTTQLMIFGKTTITTRRPDYLHINHHGGQNRHDRPRNSMKKSFLPMDQGDRSDPTIISWYVLTVIWDVEMSQGNRQTRQALWILAYSRMKILVIFFHITTSKPRQLNDSNYTQLPIITQGS
jgi:hypothetical protein